ncbi:hypothetical protein GCM10009557_53880 [Virgisporangium ochraceum]|uniref:Uncharacterized protein n=1 Tax=Virgisporangium ochraceum TaxID=65505 RepID=A0A8J4A586_9ACTN|nr:DUF6365 family protein [Virgisporangium ochraceum]GIJ75346.1 hypothetical protein Voc01_102630 [Virgisporangium ochraceum]
MTTYACYIVTSFWSYGELQMALDLAQRQRGAGIEPVFVIPPSHVAQTRAKGFRFETLVPGSGKLNVMLLRDVRRRYEPKAVILADFLNYAFCERHYGLTLDDLDLFGVPVSGIDIYDFARSGGRVDTYGFYTKGMRGVTLDRYRRLLQPTPIVPPDPPRDDRTVRYPLFEDLDPIGARERALAREELGLGTSDRMILVTSAAWQQRHLSYPGRMPFIAACLTALDEILARVAGDPVVVCVGTPEIGSSREIPRLRQYSHLPADEFARITAACDLYLSTNYVSTSMCRLVLKGVPTLLVQSSIARRPDGTYTWFGRPDAPLPALLGSVPNAYPYRMFPVGWHAFLRPALKDNDFYRIMRHTELFDTDGSVARADAILRGEDADRSQRARERYLTQLDKLPRAAEIGLP